MVMKPTFSGPPSITKPCGAIGKFAANRLLRCSSARVPARATCGSSRQPQATLSTAGHQAEAARGVARSRVSARGAVAPNTRSRGGGLFWGVGLCLPPGRQSRHPDQPGAEPASTPHSGVGPILLRSSAIAIYACTSPRARPTVGDVAIRKRSARAGAHACPHPTTS
jgi:hypothetical protein